MAAKKKKQTARERVDERLFARDDLRPVIARGNLDEALIHTKKVLAKAAARLRRR